MQKDNQVSEQVGEVQGTEKLLSFIKDNKVSYLCKKVSQITKATCLVTAHIEENKEIRMKLRSTALDMSDIAISSLCNSGTLSIKDRDVILSKSLFLVNLVELAHALKLISESNSDILLGQIKSFMFEVEELSHKISPQPSLKMSDFESEMFIQAPKPIVDEKVVLEKPKPIIETLSVSNPKEASLTRTSRSSFHPTNAVFRQRLATSKTLEDLHGLSSTIPGKEESKSAPFAKSGRQELIINTIAAKGELSIKDLEGVVKGCSEKTIQRELLALVEQGVLTKTGERRWSRYALAK
ncbi:MAG: hypothetical protein FGM57_01655 [Candidatus Taylorbacteria bacterium]|nr:hypothetical protein [Candidatus Taylorbacteria bacterium]